MGHTNNEKGAVLPFVIILIIIFGILSTSIAGVLFNSTDITTITRDSVVSKINSDSGLENATSSLIGVGGVCPEEDIVYSQSESEASQGIYYDVTYNWGPDSSVTSCSGATSVTVSTIGYSSSSATDPFAQIVTYDYTPGSATSDGDAITAAVYSDSANLSITNLTLTDGDIIVKTGDFNCNNSSKIYGNVIILSGDAHITNSCHITQSLYVGGVADFTTDARVDGDVYSLSTDSVAIHNRTFIGGNVYTNGSITTFGTPTVSGNIISTRSDTSNYSNLQGLTVGGSVYLNTRFTGNNTKIYGNIYSSSTSTAFQVSGTESYFGGSIYVNGRFSSFARATVAGSVYIGGTTSSSIAPTTTISGSLNLKNTYTTWGSGPTVSSGINTYSSFPVVANTPTFDVPVELDPTAPRNTWTDYDFDPDIWIAAGWTIVIVPSNACDYQNNASLRTAFSSYTTPTVLDMRACTNPRFYGVTLTLNTDIAIVYTPAGATAANMQSMTIQSGTGSTYKFNIIVPDTVDDDLPTCPITSGTLPLYGTQINPGIEGFAYTPCGLYFGSSNGIVWRGQLYYGNTSSGIGGNNTNIEYHQVQLPGLYLNDGTAGQANDTGSIFSGQLGQLGPILNRNEGS